MKLINEIGNRYGRLLVIERAENKGTRAQWLCQCDCGNKIVTTGKNLRLGHTKSCGCLHKDALIARNTKGIEDLSGWRFGKLVVLKEGEMFIKPNGKRVRTWVCQCDCGNICEVQTQYLRSGNTGSCGCSHSRGEAEITIFLNKNHIEFQTEYKFDNFKNGNAGYYRFDFALFNKGKLLCLIEYQGSIHFKAEGTGWNIEENLRKRQENDRIKREFCKNNNIKLYEITYLEDIIERMEEIISEQYEANR